MRVIITAGGTGGHIYPALAIVDKIKEMEPKSEFIYIGTHNRMEKDIVPKRGIKYIPIEIYGLSTSPKLMGRNVKNIFLIASAIKKCESIIKEFKPDVVIGVGGYVTYPVIRAAKKCHVPSFIHEQNSIVGKANKSLLKMVDCVGVSFKDSIKQVKHSNVVLTGNPVSEGALKKKKISKTSYGLSTNKKSVLIFNGSLGSKAINEKLLDYLNNASKPYIDNLSGLMKDIDLIVCRAGASSIAEITALGVPSVLIPSPYVANNHQYYNALSIVESNSGEMIEEDKLNKKSLEEKIDSIINNSSRQKEIKNNLSKLNIDDSATIIYNEIKKIIK